LMGDASDNIPGVPGIGEKTAIALIQEYGSIERLLAAASAISKPKLRENLLANTEQALMSRRLATIMTDLPVEVEYEQLLSREPDSAKLLALIKEFEFPSLLKEVNPPAEEGGVEADYRMVLTEDDLEELARQLAMSPAFAVDTETTSKDPMQADLVGLSFSIKGGEGWYIPMAHDYDGHPAQLPAKQVIERLRPLLESSAKKKTGQNIKYDYIVLKRAGIDLKGIAFDTMVASYCLNPGRMSHGLDAIALEHFNYRMLTYAEVCGSGAKQIPFSQVRVEIATRYSAEDADITWRLNEILAKLLEKENVAPLFYDMEMPLVEVLARMEMNGVKIDADLLGRMSVELDAKLKELMGRIHRLAGEEFNINSPKQLAEVLFEKLKLPPLKKTKTGYSTDVEVLQSLAGQHELPADILEYRSLSKLKSTYVDVLPAMINPQTGRVHTSFNQTVTATGRLSSSEPNLQNIPIRTELGRRIREAFIAEPGCLLLSADYSQIELRVLAHLSKDPILIDAFKRDEDIHTRTAAEVFGVFPQMVTSEMRRQAKVVNFGILYGMSPHGLAQDLGIPQKEAKRYIENYFARYPSVKSFLDTILEQGRATGYVTTMMGRRRAVPELHASNAVVRQAGERFAINTPIQGTAADLIKVAMIAIHRRLINEKLSSRMILQVHDELVFEVPEPELARMKQLVCEEMEGVAALEIPVKVDIELGRNWGVPLQDENFPASAA
ncbi:MAG: DNA polymerase I, partial [Nitrospirota bacterium]|nr:DNA polymerase I [Nitrospirota bacterium]